VQKAHRFPITRPMIPVLAAAMIEEATKAVVGQLIRAAPPISVRFCARWRRRSAR
jgi:hypothetical protein